MSESRGELIQWVNQLTGLGLTKVEQCGKGYACAQIFDSIYGDVPLKKIDFNANAEFKYLANWKVIQTHFNKHKIDKVIPVERLAKCKMQDNLEFLQWTKKYWDQMFPGGDYNATARRGAPGSAGLGSSVSSHHATPAAAPPRKASNVSTSSAAPRRAAASAPVRTAARPAPVNNTQILDLQFEIGELTDSVTALNRERDFYFGKLRDIEVLIQNAQATTPAEGEDADLLGHILEVLYSTEDGFEVPDNQLANEENNANEAEQGVQGLHRLSVTEDAQGDEDEVF